MLKLSTPLLALHLHEIPRLGQKTGLRLAAGIAAAGNAVTAQEATVDDLLHYLPMRYEDRSRLAKIRDLKPGIFATVQVEIRVAGTYQVKGGRLHIFEISAQDGSGQIRAFWWNQSYLQKTFLRGRKVLLYGQWKRNDRGFFEVENPDYEFIIENEADPIHTGRRVAVYRKCGEIRTRELRSIHLSRRESPGLVECK